MSIRSMTGFAQVKGQINGQLSFTLSLKSVNHRFRPSFPYAVRKRFARNEVAAPSEGESCPGSLWNSLSIDRGGSEGPRAEPRIGWRIHQSLRAAPLSLA